MSELGKPVDVSISIVNWNSGGYLRVAVHSIFENPPSSIFEIIVVDNASTDNSLELMSNEYPDVKIINSKLNVGFGAGHNIAFKVGTGRYRMPLNPDSLVEKRAIDSLIKFADEHECAGIVGPKLLNPDSSLQYSCRKFPSVGAAIFRNSLFDKLFPNNRVAGDYLMREFDHNHTTEVDWVSGAAMLIKKEVLDKISGFDETFFMYCEDIDLCKRASDAGWKVYYYPEAVIFHAIGKSSDAVANKMTRQHHKSMYLYYKKYTSAHTSPLIRPLVPIGLWVRSQATVFRNNLTSIKRRFGKK